MLGGIEAGAPTQRERRRQRAHIAALRRAYGKGDTLRAWIDAAEAGHLRTRKGQLDRWRRTLAEIEADRRRRMGVIYLLHFSEPIGDLSNPRGQAQHYIGWARDLEARLEAHRNGTGARIMAAVEAAGIPWSVVRVWRGTREFERSLKNRHRASDFCPICQAALGQEVRPVAGLDDLQLGGTYAIHSATEGV